MSIKIKENLGRLVSSSGKATYTPVPPPQVGKVFGVITTKNTPTKELFEKYGGYNGIGTIFYLDYMLSKNIEKTDLNKCKVAFPFNSNIQDYPLIGELVHIISLPSPGTQLKNTVNKSYYTGVINLFNNNQQNSPLGNTLGLTFIEKKDVRTLLPFEGDRTYQGRKGNGLRFSSTVKYHANLNEWSSIGNDGDPITILTNGYVTSDTGSLSPNIEEINKEMSSIYMTSTQLIPLTPDRIDTLNPITQPFPPNKYTNGSQIILNSDRITLNSKKDEVMIFAKTNIEISTNNIINLNAGSRVHLNTKYVFLGTKKDGTVPTEPLLLGNKTVQLLTQLLKVLGELGNSLTQTISPPLGGPIPTLNAAGTTMVNQLNSLQEQLKNIVSSNNFTI